MLGRRAGRFSGRRGGGVGLTSRLRFIQEPLTPRIHALFASRVLVEQAMATRLHALFEEGKHDRRASDEPKRDPSDGRQPFERIERRLRRRWRGWRRQRRWQQWWSWRHGGRGWRRGDRNRAKERADKRVVDLARGHEDLCAACKVPAAPKLAREVVVGVRVDARRDRAVIRLRWADIPDGLVPRTGKAAAANPKRAAVAFARAVCCARDGREDEVHSHDELAMEGALEAELVSLPIGRALFRRPFCLDNVEERRRCRSGGRLHGGGSAHSNRACCVATASATSARSSCMFCLFGNHRDI